MNIFHLSDCPTQSAKWQVDRHAVKMGLEQTQMFCTAFWLQNIDAPYKCISNPTHRSAVWMRKSKENLLWFIEHSYTTFQEYTARYSKRHKSQDVLDWCVANMDKLSFNTTGLTEFAVAIKEDKICRTLPEFDENNPVNCYRLYYIHDKKHIHQWKQNKPDWID
jgi:hypothetical protein